MIPIRLGTNTDTGEPVFVDPDTLRTHMHLIGVTGSGKTVALLTMLYALFLQTTARNVASYWRGAAPSQKLLSRLRAGDGKGCVFVIDPIGNLSYDLLRFIAHPRYCPQHVRDRLVYIEPAQERFVLPFNPLTFTSEANRYYQTMRTVDIVLRAWDAQDVSQQPRLLQWMFKAFCAAAQLGFPIAMCRFLLHPGTPEHKAIIHRIPGEVGAQWQRILHARGESEKILESARNRLDPFFNSPNLLRMFGTRTSRLDCERFIRERRIVILNLGRYGTINQLIADTIGGLALNEIFETANRLSTTFGRSAVDPTYIVMDEFQRYVGVDIEDALPTVRQMGLRLILAHQSFSQLEREDVDLTQMIWQARSRLIFANYARDADILADELAKLTFDARRIKDVRTSVKQLIVGYRKEWLESESTTSTHSSATMDQRSLGYNQSRGESLGPNQFRPTTSEGRGDTHGTSTANTDAASSGQTHGRSQANVPIHKDITEVTKITFESFEEAALKWGQRIRRRGTGEAFAMFPNDPDVHSIAVAHFPIDETPEMEGRVAELLNRNYESDFFLTAAEADQELAECRRTLFTSPPIVIDRTLPDQSTETPKPAGDPFR